jgi:hypothetical protein
MGERVHFIKLDLKFLRRKLLVHVISLNLLEFCVNTFFKEFFFFEEIFGGHYYKTLCFREMDDQCQESNYIWHI